MIRLTNPARLGPALADIRQLHGLTRPDLARIISDNTGRPLKAVINQLGDWDTCVNVPTASSLGPVLDALGYDLALIPREEPDEMPLDLEPAPSAAAIADAIAIADWPYVEALIPGEDA